MWNNTTRFLIEEYPRVLGPRSTETLYNRCFQLIDFITADIYEVEPPVAGKLRIQRWAILALGFFYSAGSQIRPGRGSVFSLVLPASLFSVIIFMQAKCSYRKFMFSSFFQFIHPFHANDAFQSNYHFVGFQKMNGKLLYIISSFQILKRQTNFHKQRIQNRLVVQFKFLKPTQKRLS